MIAEVKRLRRNYDHKKFMEKIECVKTRILSKYKIEIRLLTLEDNQFSDMSKRLDQMQHTACRRTGAGNVAGVLRNLRLDQNNVEHTFASFTN